MTIPTNETLREEFVKTAKKHYSLKNLTGYELKNISDWWLSRRQSDLLTLLGEITKGVQAMRPRGLEEVDDYVRGHTRALDKVFALLLSKRTQIEGEVCDCGVPFSEHGSGANGHCTGAKNLSGSAGSSGKK